MANLSPLTSDLVLLNKIKLVALMMMLRQNYNSINEILYEIAVDKLSVI